MKHLFLLFAYVINHCYCGAYITNQRWERSNCPLSLQESLINFATSSNVTHPFSLFWPLQFSTLAMRSDQESVTQRECKASANNKASKQDPIWDQSFCPWEQKINYDPLRIPNSLPEAVCKCDRIVLDKPFRYVSECEPVYFTIKVIKVNADCSTFVESSEDISLACVAIPEEKNIMLRGLLQDITASMDYQDTILFCLCNTVIKFFIEKFFGEQS